MMYHRAMHCRTLAGFVLALLLAGAIPNAFGAELTGSVNPNEAWRLASGCTFDLWADDVPTYPIEVRDAAEVWVRPSIGDRDAARHWHRQLDHGLARDLALVIAKAARGQLAA